MTFFPSSHHDVLPFIRISPEQRAAVEAWWQAFSKDQHLICDTFNGEKDTAIDISAWMHCHLSNIDNDLMWEFGPGIEKAHRLVITAEDNRPLRPLVQYILSKAPKNAFLEFYGYRLAEGLIEAQHTMSARTSWHDISEIEFELASSNFNTLGIIYYTPPGLSQAQEAYSYNSYVLTEALLGEEILDKWIDYIEVQPKPKKGLFSRTKHVGTPLATLKEAVLKAINLNKSRLPQEPYFKLVHNKQIKWALYEATPNEQPDYPRKQDFYIASFILTEGDLFNATYQGADQFFSERYSKHNEVFVYLKIDGTAEDLNQEVFIDRCTIEDILNEALLREGLGGVIGGGTGLRYSYIDFALVNIERAFPLMQKILQEGKLTKRSWILFHDAVYQDQWIGVWEDSPPPIL